MQKIKKKYAGPRNRTWVSSATTMCTDHYTRPALSCVFGFEAVGITSTC
ncbi:unnamed protein product [Debaryomyces tyrocola]|nr:unnamed protein product [Debaryomyces tyrocola]